MASRLCSLVLAMATIAALASAALASDKSPLMRLHPVRTMGRVNSSYNVAQDYWHIETNHTFPEVTDHRKGQLKRGDGGAGDRSCWVVAQDHVEPYSDFFAPRGTPAQVRLPRPPQTPGRR
jgi:hypothetical protein